MLVRGDANCDGGCDVSDAVLICRLAVEDRNAHITDQGIANADANRDGKMDSDDVVEILNWIAYLVQW
ncbi:MAG: glycoside hydrolase, partial [Oscillospiraceae bacterium]|nr:glycoside hydrolase [Oscillospiraceae bacterium]